MDIYDMTGSWTEFNDTDDILPDEVIAFQHQQQQIEHQHQLQQHQHNETFSTMGVTVKEEPLDPDQYHQIEQEQRGESHDIYNENNNSNIRRYMPDWRRHNEEEAAMDDNAIFDFEQPDCAPHSSIQYEGNIVNGQDEHEPENDESTPADGELDMEITETTAAEDTQISINYESAVVYICPSCGAEFDTQESWRRHLNFIHQYNTRRGLNFIQRDRLYHECLECHKLIAMNSMENLLKHKFTHLPFRCTKCRYCLRQYKYRQDLKTHLRLMHRMELTEASKHQKNWLKEASSSFNEAPSGDGRSRLAIMDIKENAFDIFEGTHDGTEAFNFKTQKYLNNRQQVSTGMMGNINGDNDHPSFLPDESQQSSSASELIGNSVDQFDDNVGELDEHVVYLCPKCKAECNTEVEWRQHLASAHDYDTLEGLDFMERPGSANVQCRICNKMLDRKSLYRLQQHKFVHLSLRWLLRCKICLTSFISHKGTLKHLARQHRIYPKSKQQQLNGNNDNNGHNDDDTIAEGEIGVDNGETPFKIPSMTAPENDDDDRPFDLFPDGLRFLADDTDTVMDDTDNQNEYSEFYDPVNRGDMDDDDNDGDEGDIDNDFGDDDDNDDGQRLLTSTKKSKTVVERDQYEKHTRYLCPQCGREFVDKKLWRKHITHVHQMSDLRVLNYRTIGLQQVQCNECDKIITNAYGIQNAQQHRFTHMPFKAFIRCSFCRKSYTDRKGLVKHLRSVHKVAEDSTLYRKKPTGTQQQQQQQQQQQYQQERNPSSPSIESPFLMLTSSSPTPPPPPQLPPRPEQIEHLHPPQISAQMMMTQQSNIIAKKRAAALAVAARVRQSMPCGPVKIEPSTISCDDCELIREVVRHQDFIYEIQYLSDDEDENQYHRTSLNDMNTKDRAYDESILGRQLKRPLPRTPSNASSVHDESAWPFMDDHHEEFSDPSAATKKWTCSDCGSVFAKQIYLQQHVRDNHDHDDDDDSDNKVKNKNISQGDGSKVPYEKPRGKNGRFTSENNKSMRKISSVNAQKDVNSQMKRLSTVEGDDVPIPLGGGEFGLERYFCLLCPACGKEFGQQSEWRHHINNVHMYHQREKLSFRVVDKYHLRCTICNSNVLNTKLKTLQDHKFRHLPYKQYIRCLLCGFRYNHKPNMQTHLRVRHGLTDDRENITYRNKSMPISVKSKSMSIGENPQSSEGKGGLIRGKALPIGLKPNRDSVSFYNAVDHPTIKYHCPTCNVHFDTHVFWRKHIVDEHNYNTRQGLNFRQVDAHHYLCLECNRRVTVAHAKGAIGQLQSHKFRHLPYRSFHCMKCAGAFIRKQMFFKHLNKRTNSCDRTPWQRDNSGGTAATDSNVLPICCLNRSEDGVGVNTSLIPSALHRFVGDLAISPYSPKRRKLKPIGDLAISQYSPKRKQLKPLRAVEVLDLVHDVKNKKLKEEIDGSRTFDNTGVTATTTTTTTDGDETSLFEQHYENNLVNLPPPEFSNRGFVIVCPQCGEPFTCWRPWREHINNVHSFSDRQNLHFTRVRSRTYRCDECGERITGSKLSNLQFHYFKHLPYSSIMHCLLCKVSYQRIKNMTTHMLRCHPEFVPKIDQETHRERNESLHVNDENTQGDDDGLKDDEDGYDNEDDVINNTHDKKMDGKAEEKPELNTLPIVLDNDDDDDDEDDDDGGGTASATIDDEERNSNDVVGDVGLEEDYTGLADVDTNVIDGENDVCADDDDDDDDDEEYLLS